MRHHDQHRQNSPRHERRGRRDSDGRGRDRRHRRRRVFDQGELSLVLLHLTRALPRHGYEMIREIEALTGGDYAPSPGVIYPTLTLLEELGQLERQSEGTKRLFALTEAGRTHLTNHQPKLEAALARLQALHDEGDRFEASPIWRAMQNLRTVLEPRLVAPADKQVQFAIVDLIDEAARKIERL